MNDHANGVCNSTRAEPKPKTAGGVRVYSASWDLCVDCKGHQRQTEQQQGHQKVRTSTHRVQLRLSLCVYGDALHPEPHCHHTTQVCVYCSNGMRAPAINALQKNGHACAVLINRHPPRNHWLTLRYNYNAEVLKSKKTSDVPRPVPSAVPSACQQERRYAPTSKERSSHSMGAV